MKKGSYGVVRRGTPLAYGVLCTLNKWVWGIARRCYGRGKCLVPTMGPWSGRSLGPLVNARALRDDVCIVSRAVGLPITLHGGKVTRLFGWRLRLRP